MIRKELLERAKPILFNTEMVKAILDGRKTCTRRVVKNTEIEIKDNYIRIYELDRHGERIGNVECGFPYNEEKLIEFMKMNYAPYQVGDILYVRETWREQPVGEYGHIEFEYKADFNEAELACYGRRGGWTPRKWKPSIHMSKELARIFLKVTDVRVERLQDITINKLIEEGFGCIGHPVDTPWYEVAYDRLKEILDCKDEDWLWVIEFERLEVE